MPARGVHKRWGDGGATLDKEEIARIRQNNRNKRCGMMKHDGSDREKLSLIPCLTRHPEIEERIRRYRERVERGLPLFE